MSQIETETRNMGGVTMSLDGAQRVQETRCDPAEDVRRIQAGEIDREGLLAECLDGVDEGDAERRAEWEAYVSDVMLHVVRVTPWALQIVAGDAARSLGWHTNLAVAMTAGERYLKAHEGAELQVRRGEDGEVLPVEL